MKRREILATCATATAALALPWRWAAAVDERPQRVLFFTRNVGFYHSVVQRSGDTLSHAERAFVDLGKRAGIEVVCTKDGRVFSTSMAHRENVWVEEPFQQMVLGGLAWVLGNVDADVTPNIDTVTPLSQSTTSAAHTK